MGLFNKNIIILSSHDFLPRLIFAGYHKATPEEDTWRGQRWKLKASSPSYPSTAASLSNRKSHLRARPPRATVSGLPDTADGSRKLQLQSLKPPELDSGYVSLPIGLERHKSSLTRGSLRLLRSRR
ncbi:hypothetical protein COLO4_08299 [Corchorus olitorius]|uniref:Uncharacterized protein n=1 Tax=Corchorus olitorius TaxID=93759 RepID=A0A1R3KGI4_9ROSI|nr:hypothetical protein COLO4_08299 [Corchorus olitorius]